MPADVIPFFYINLDKSTDRRQSLERDFVVALQEHHSLTAALNRVPAISTTEVELMLQNGTFILNGIDNLRYEIKRKHKKEYSYNEAACTLSHLKAIKQAYDEGRDIVIVIEDDVNITKEFMENWKQYIAQAPRDWKVLQMTTNNNDINKQELHKVHDYWINWEPSHWATISYVINREGMKEVLGHTFKRDDSLNGIGDRWEFDEPNIMVADEVIYYLVQNSYTSTYPWVTGKHFTSTMEKGHSGIVKDLTFGQLSTTMPLIGDTSLTHRSETIAVVMSCRIKGKEDILQELAWLKVDMDVLAKNNPRSRWLVNAVVADDALASLFTSMVSTMDITRADIRVRVDNDRVNKFAFVHTILGDLDSYDYVLLKDSGMRMAGFRWNTFMNLKGDSIVAEPMRLGIESQMYRYWNRDLSKVPELSKVRLDTMADFVVMRSDFAVWFFKQILTDHFIQNRITDCGPALMWCGAAHAFNRLLSDDKSASIPCSLVPVYVLQLDKKQVGHLDEAEYDHHVIDQFTQNKTFAGWIDTSSALKPSTRTFNHAPQKCKIRK